MSDTVSIQTGNQDVIASGVVSSFAGQPIEITIVAVNVRTTVVFQFIDDGPPGTVPVLEFAGTNRGVNVLLRNFGQGLGTGTVAPLRLGDVDGRVLSLHLRVTALRDSQDRWLTYTFFLAKEASK